MTINKPTLRKKLTVPRRDIFRLAGDAGLDPRTVQRAIECGIDSMKSEVNRTRLRETAAKLKIVIE